MKRALLCLAVLGTAAFLGGCPIYSNQSDYRVCNGAGCFDCPDPSYSDMCVPWSCSTDSDCPYGYSCNGVGQCSVASSGDDASSPSPIADCSVVGCPAGQVCKLAGGTTSCVTLGGTEDAGPWADDATVTDDGSLPTEASTDAATAQEAAADAATSPDTGEGTTPTEAGADDALSSEAAAAATCNANGDCAVGALCVDGVCTAQANLCSDGSQCAAAGYSCVNGLCVPTCSASTPCPSGYACDFGLGVCDLNPAACTGSGTSSCVGGSVCVESHCVPPCSQAEGGPACPTGQLCVNGGCIPDQKALFSCRNDGASGGLANTCDSTSVCVHHDCYVACDGDGGGCPASQCKQVTVHAGTYAVCGTPTTLGSDCDYASGSTCPSAGVCVDGYCR
jgi:hypothetical protein